MTLVSTEAIVADEYIVAASSPSVVDDIALSLVGSVSGTFFLVITTPSPAEVELVLGSVWIC